MSDGWIGDAAHQTRDSDHNPWIVQNGVGVVTARDITRDDVNGPNLEWLALDLVADRRCKYVIFDHRIASQGGPWRPYDGENPHEHHLHLSVNSFSDDYDDSSHWLRPPLPFPYPVRSPEMFLYARQDDNDPDAESDVRLHAGPLPTAVGTNQAEIVKALRDPGYVALVGPIYWQALVDAGRHAVGLS